MEFISTDNFDSDAEKIFWEATKKAFKNKEPGYCWHNHPFTTYTGATKRPDFVILHPAWGLNVIEIKGCLIDQIEEIEGDTWYMQNYNEASLVYVYGFEEVETNKKEDIVRMRNTAFTAMTRTKGWLVLTGVGFIANKLFQEIDSILEEVGRVKFIVPDINKIQRNLETYENQRRRKRINKATKSVEKLLENREDVEFDDLPKEQREQLLKWISKSKINNEN